MKFLYTILAIVSVMCWQSTTLHAQSCALNIDFEEGSFQDWFCDSGRARITGNVMVPTSPVVTKHTLIKSDNRTLDPYGDFPLKSPDGSNYFIKLGNENVGAEAEGVNFSFLIPPGQTSYSITYWYAVVFQNPNHSPSEQPKFSVKVTDLTEQREVTCASFEYVVNAALPGFTRSRLSPTILYKAWTPVTVKLDNKAGHVIKIEFTTNDCTLGGHFGYAYVDIETQCGSTLRGAGYCSDATEVTLKAPFGFQSYRWYNADFTQLLGNQSELLLNPLPPPGTQYAVVVEPYPGYGCSDTLKTFTRVGQVDRFSLSDITICSTDSALLRNIPDVPGLVYNWSPGFGLSNPKSGITRASPLDSTRYKLTITDTSSGCFRESSMNLNVIKYSNHLAIDGDTIVCGNKPPSARLWIQPSQAQVQWELDSVPFPGATGYDFRSPRDGRVRVKFNLDGCSIYSRTVWLKPSPQPTAGFDLQLNGPCVKNNFLQVVSRPAGTRINSWTWDWGNGTKSTDSTQTYQYPAAGQYRVNLTVRTREGCSDSAAQNIVLYGEPALDFAVENNCVFADTRFVNKTPAVPGSQTGFTWNLGNGSGNLNGKDVTSRFRAAGGYQVSLRAATDQCRDTVEIRRRINIQSAPAAKSKSIRAAAQNPIVLESPNKGIQYQWRPTQFLQNPNSETPVFTGDQSTQYLVQVDFASGCFAVDTVQVSVFDKVSVWVPTAFTPNGDGKNDFLSPVLVGMDQLEYFRIWNRWGQLVFETKTPKPGWDGFFQGRKAEAGTFVWEVLAKGPNNQAIRQKGVFTLIR